ncbi:cell adhesion molecule CEACAM20-like [Polymixia lowei]
MDLFKMKSLVFFLSVFGCCAASPLPAGPLDGVLGKNVTFQTILGPTESFLTIAWNFNPGPGTTLVPVISVAPKGETVGEGYKGRVSVNSTTGVMMLGPLEAKDSGDYAISLVDAAGRSKAGEIKLRVLEPVSNVEIKSNVSEAVEFNSTVVLTCSAKGSFLKFSWTNGTQPIVADGKRLTVAEEATSSKLTVDAVLRSDLVGPIYCTAANKLETEKSAPFNLTVNYGPENIAMAWVNTPIIRKGSNVTMMCSAQSSPAATFKWYHNGNMLETNGPQLVLSNIDEKQGGNYSCMAHNTKTMRYVSTMAKFTVLEAISGTKIMGPTATLVAGNHTANLSCQATQGTVTTRAWMKDGKPLSPSDRVVLASDMSSVMFKTVKKEDNGEFKCQLTNGVNTESASYKMVVNYGPEEVKVAGEQAVEVKDPVSIKCSAMSIPPANFTWKFNGTLTAVKTAEYTILHAVYKNTGMYTCEAYNAVTGLSATASHVLSVKEEGALDEGLSEGAVAGIVIGVLIALAIVIGAVIYCRRKQAIESPY